MRKPIAGSTYVVNRNVAYPDDLSVNAQDTLLNIMVWMAIAFGIGALVYTFWFQ